MRIFKGHDAVIRCLAYSPDGTLLAAGDESGHVRLWALSSGEEVAGRLLRRHRVEKTAEQYLRSLLRAPRNVADARRDKGSVECLAFSPSGSLAIGVSEEILLWNTDAVHEGVELQRTNDSTTVGLIPDVPTLESGLVIDTSETPEVHRGHSRRPRHAGGTRGVAWQPDGKLLVSCGWNRAVCFWTEELATRWEPVTAPEPMMALAFTPNGKRLALAGNSGTLILLDMPQRKKSDELKHDRALFSLACAPDGRLVAAGDAKGDIILWDTTGETAPRTLHGHEWTVYGVAFTPDGNSLISGSADGTVRLWEVGTGRLIETFRWHTRWVTSVAVSPDGMTAASGSADGTIVVWDLADV